MDVVYKLDITGFRCSTLATTVEAIQSSSKKLLGDLRLFDLLYSPDDGNNDALRHGIYIFFDDNDCCLYVGMCSSSHFAHRIGGHFGMSPKYGMNTFLRRAVKDMGLNEKEYESYVKALKKMENYSLLIVNANKTGKRFIRSLEKVLHITLAPRLNFPKGVPRTYMDIPLETSLDEALHMCGGI